MMDIDKIKELVKLFREEELTKLKVEEDALKIHIEKSGGIQNASPAENSTGSEDRSPSGDTSSNLMEIKAPQVGTFYMQKEEDSDENFVAEGDNVKKGDQVGIIEAMKVFNDITTEHQGVIEKILVGNGDSVEYDQVLMTLRKEDE